LVCAVRRNLTHDLGLVGGWIADEGDTGR